MKSISILSLLFFAAQLSAQTFVYDTAMIDGWERNWFVYESPVLDQSVPVPLVLNLHGAGSSAAEQAIYSQFKTVADTVNVVTLYPNAIANFWNSGFEITDTILPDDVLFLTALVDTMKARYNIDENRVYTMGMSNGGIMSYRLVCETSEIFAAMASVTGTMTQAVLDNCNPSGPTPVLQMHGTSDDTVPFEGVTDTMVAQEDVIEYWATFNNCPSPSITDLPDLTVDATTVDLERYYVCDDYSEVMFYIIDKGGHSWPGSFPLPGFGNTNQDINAEVEIWEFFRRHSLDQQFTAIEELTQPQISVGPNPFVNRVLISAEGSFTVRMSDLQGRVVETFRGNGSAVLYPQVEHGIYLLEVESAAGTETFKLIRAN